MCEEENELLKSKKAQPAVCMVTAAHVVYLVKTCSIFPAAASGVKSALKNQLLLLVPGCGGRH